MIPMITTLGHGYVTAGAADHNGVEFIGTFGKRLIGVP
jgi:hypothetical protein